MPVRVVIVDDHTMVRQGIRYLLSQQCDIEVVGEFQSGADVVAAADSLGADVVLMDIAMSDMNGLDATRRLRQDHPHLKIIMVSMHATADYVVQALHSGATGYLIKRSAAEEIGKAIGTVMGGGVYIDSHLPRRAIENHLQHVKPGELPQAILTERQRQILQLLTEGCSTKIIAAKLNLSPKTVESHRSQVMQRLEIYDIPGLVRYAIRVGLTSVDL